MANIFCNRELSWLKFNERVLEEAECEDQPLWERLKFIAIFGSNLDEFYRVRVGSLTDMAAVNPDKKDNKTCLTVSQQIEKINKSAAELCARRDRAYAVLMDRLAEKGVGRVYPESLPDDRKKILKAYFDKNVRPLLSPQVVDQKEPFPSFETGQPVVVARLVEKGNEDRTGAITVPSGVADVWRVGKNTQNYMHIEDIIAYFAADIFHMYKLKEVTVISVTRNADIDTDAGFSDEELDFRDYMKKLLKKRARLAPVRLLARDRVSDGFRKTLLTRLGLKKEQMFVVKAPIRMDFVYSMPSDFSEAQRRELLDEPFTPAASADVSDSRPVFAQVQKKDLLLSYPYQSMDVFLRLLKESAEDKNVTSISITLYRIAKVSKLAGYLVRAADNGKKVFVLMELRARFDEANNIDWSEQLEAAGVRVKYGFEGYKVHSKICLIERRDGSRITQVGTGNYNEKTARLYTDLSLISADRQLGEDAAAFFRNMEEGELDGSYKKLWIAPAELKPRILEKIREQTALAKSGRSAAITMKMNSLTDLDVMSALAEASVAGADIMLIVRGICCLLPGIEGATDRIKVISIVGRFLEHSRIFVFGAEKETASVLISSADMMSRNTERRVEIACPIEDRAARERVFAYLDMMINDNCKAREMNSDGTYTLRTPQAGETRRCAQLMRLELERTRKRSNKSFFARLLFWRR